jgi:CheY-like chemotaxis protein
MQIPRSVAQSHALVVAADSSTRNTCRIALRRLGLSVASLDSGVAAIVSAREKSPDVVILDPQLRDSSASEVIGWLRSNPTGQFAPIVVLGRYPFNIGDEQHRNVVVLKTPSGAAIGRVVETLLNKETGSIRPIPKQMIEKSNRVGSGP